MAAISAQRLCPTSKVPAPLPAGDTLAEPEPLAREPLALLDAALAADEAADRSALDAEAEMDEIAEEACAEMEEETAAGTLSLAAFKNSGKYLPLLLDAVPLPPGGAGAGAVPPLVIVVVPEVTVVDVAGTVAVTLVNVIPGIVIVVDGEAPPPGDPPGAPAGSVHVVS
jgi:hypothetical protein